MSILYILHCIEWVLWLFVAVSVLYIFIFAVLSLFYRPDKQSVETNQEATSSFLILFPAYHEDRVIISSVKQCLQQDYPIDKYHIVVISDHMSDATNNELRQLPITLFLPTFDKSSKAKALQYAIDHTSETYDYVVILDADNHVGPTLLSQLSTYCHEGYQAIQCHRCAKNADNSISVLDGVSEEINNSLFRRGQNVIGLPAGLIGSGMCFAYPLFKSHVHSLGTAVEDRELEALLLKERVFIKYVDDIYVYDEKVNNQQNFQRQRLRWMSGQVQSLIAMLPHLLTAIKTSNIGYINKTLQEMLIPRSILTISLFLITIVYTIIEPFGSIKWWILLLLTCISLVISTPSYLRKRSVFNKLYMFPILAYRMISNLFSLDYKSNNFIHTIHNK